MKSTFNLWPVGQGLFYSGSIDIEGELSFNFIYDCGTNSGQQYLNNSVDRYLGSISRFGKQVDYPLIDMLVISHFDQDHVSGLGYLLEELSKHNSYVKKIYIPYNNTEDLLLFLSYIYGNTTSYTNVVLILIRPTNNLEFENDERTTDEVFFEELPEELHPYIANGVTAKIMKGSQITVDNIWKFKFYNFASSNTSVTGIKQSIDNLLQKANQSLSEFLKEKANREQFKNIYEEFVERYKENSELNQSSLCLYHAPICLDDSVSFNLCRCYSHFSRGSRYYSDFCRCCYRCHHGITTRKLGTMLTGDISLVSKEEIAECAYQDFLKFFDSEKSETGIFLVPHHGSKNNWNKDIITAFKRPIFINSSGLGNRDKHPNTVVVNDILNANCDFWGSDQTRMVTYDIEHIKNWYLDIKLELS